MSSSMKIDSPIVQYRVVTPDTESPAEESAPQVDPNVQFMNEAIKRPDVLVGRTYKLKIPEHVSKHSMFITINDMILNEGTPQESLHPFEIFINCKAMENFQWIVALTRIMSAVFRKGGDVNFLVEELRSVFDPAGGFFSGGKMVPSLVAEIGNVIERHMLTTGFIQPEAADPHMIAFLAKKRAELIRLDNPEEVAEIIEPESIPPGFIPVTITEKGKTVDLDQYPASATVCNKCSEKAAVIMDGCATCLACGDSKCG